VAEAAIPGPISSSTMRSSRRHLLHLRGRASTPLSASRPPRSRPLPGAAPASSPRPHVAYHKRAHWPHHRGESEIDHHPDRKDSERTRSSRRWGLTTRHQALLHRSWLRGCGRLRRASIRNPAESGNLLRPHPDGHPVTRSTCRAPRSSCPRSSRCWRLPAPPEAGGRQILLSEVWGVE